MMRRSVYHLNDIYFYRTGAVPVQYWAHGTQTNADERRSVSVSASFRVLPRPIRGICEQLRAAGFLKDEQLLDPTPLRHRVGWRLARHQPKSTAAEELQELRGRNSERRPARVRAEREGQIDIGCARLQ